LCFSEARTEKLASDQLPTFFSFSRSLFTVFSRQGMQNKVIFLS
jgi:hypothetical protein